MEPIDYRNTTFREQHKLITGMREKVLAAWQRHGPCTTEQLANISGISILTLRPRTTELYQLGYLRLVEDSNKKQVAGSVHEGRSVPSGRGGIYEAVTLAEAMITFNKRVLLARTTQQEFRF